MKHTLLFCIIFLPLVARAQDSINPYITHQEGTVELHGRLNVYYNPMAPPGPLDSAYRLSCVAQQLLDSNDINQSWPNYQPIIYDLATHGYLPLQQWPSGAPLGPFAQWQRLFQSLHGDIVAGGLPGDSVVITKNEDVDFRAHGIIKLKSGFRAMAGCRFHAYTEPKWDTTVFCDEFDSSALDRSKWYVGKGWGDYNSGAECSSDSNVFMVSDTDAHDGHAVDIIIREIPDSCACTKTDFNVRDNCVGVYDRSDTILHYKFSSAILTSCPWPWTSVSDSALGGPTYQHGPYGKYEIRIKIPHIEFHNNTWGSNDFEWDLNEEWNRPLNQLRPAMQYQIHHGPFRGIFGRHSLADTTPVFRCSQAHFSKVNVPSLLIINGFPYNVKILDTAGDTCLYPIWQTAWGGGWPYSVAHSPDSFIFYYDRQTNNTADATTWHVRQDTHGTWRLFEAPYRGSILFSKSYQPTSITITAGFGLPKTYNCHWDASVNHSGTMDTIYMDDTLSPGDLDSNTEAYSYTVDEQYGNYPMVPVPFDGDNDSTGYKYHTYAVEILPHEERFLVDSMVVSRVPDRLIPSNHFYYDRASQLVRSIPDIELNDVDIDLTTTDPYGLDSSINYISSGDTVYNSVVYAERHYFETHPHNPGRGWVTIGGIPYNAAHILVDYFKVWDVPKDVYIPPFPY